MNWPKSPRILVVDDSMVVRRVLAVTLRQIPEFLYATIDEAENGAVALRRLATAAPYDLMLSDVRMPELDGLELLRRVRADPRILMLPVVLITTLGAEADLARGREAGATGYICKPIAPHSIIKALQQILELRSRR